MVDELPDVWDFKIEEEPAEDAPLTKRWKHRVAVEKLKLQLPRETVGEVANRLIEMIRKEVPINRATICGSYRRGNPTVGDADILFLPQNPADAKRILNIAASKASDVFANGIDVFHGIILGIPVDILITNSESWGSSLQHMTGDWLHNRYLRTDAKANGLKMNEWGVWNSDDIRIAGEDEHQVYEAIGKRWIEPKFRQDRRHWKAQEYEGPLKKTYGKELEDNEG